MKVCMIGLGSIGCRHLRNLAASCAKRNIALSVDALRSGKRALPQDIAPLIQNEYFSVEALPSFYDAIFITNPTSKHYETMQQVVSKTTNLFIEKPVFDHTDVDLSQFKEENDKIYYVACPMRHMKVTKYLKEFVKENPVFSARAICSTYLPDWRPGVDYRDTYSASRALGGGVTIDLIHEWDYLCYLFGEPERVCNFNGTYSNLEITSDDLSVYIAKYRDKLVSLHLDYFGRFGKREIELYTADDVVVGDFINSKVKFLKSGKIIDFSEQRNDFQVAEIEYFLDLLSGKEENINSVTFATNILKIAKGETAQ